jgi:hypothetical protein
MPGPGGIGGFPWARGIWPSSHGVSPFCLSKSFLIAGKDAIIFYRRV